jgi:multicomponent Na+:H+ antiporter subunit E
MSRLGLRPGNVIFAVWLIVVWTLLWGGPTLANLLSGALLVAVLLIFVPRPDALVAADAPIIRPLAAVSFAGWFAWKLIESNLTVAVEVLRPSGRSRIRTGVVAVALPGCPNGIATAVANVITLTPGTLTLEIGPATPVLYVHVLQLLSEDKVREDVYEIERRIVAAVGSQAARDAVASRALPVEEDAS